MEKEPWDSSTEKAKELKLSDFGTQEEVSEMAKMPRIATTKDEAVAFLKEIAASGTLKSKTGIVVSLSGKSIAKITNDPAIHQSFNIQAHWKAAANVDKLFKNAIEPWKFELNPRKNNENLMDRRYFYTPMEYNEHVVIVKFTVKEFKEKRQEKRLYSLEAVNVSLL